MIFKGLGAIPGPIVYGAVLDGACLFKQSSCHAADASCVVMDNRKASQARILWGFPLSLSLSSHSISFAGAQSVLEEQDRVGKGEGMEGLGYMGTCLG